MEKEPHNGIRNILLGVIGVLLLVLGIVIGLIIAGILSDQPLMGGAETSSESLQTTGETLEETGEDTSGESAAGQNESGETAGEDTEEAGSESVAETETVPETMAAETLPETESGAAAETVPETEPIRIVLDPGHDDYCSRNHPDLGVNEQDINLKIALACRDELETYEGVEVFMTREDGSCPDNGQGSDDVTGRTAYAGSVDADLFVSLHNNATGLGYPSEANGAEVYITVYSQFTDESRKLGESILSELTSQVDLANRGVLTRVKADKGYYDDGNTKDWYYLISTCIDQGFPGIIIEHAFMDNPHDNAILKDDSQLQAMGVADATGIANYFGLEKRE